MKKFGPLLQMTSALVALTGALVILADLFFGVLPDRTAQALALRKNVSEAIAVQVAVLLQAEDEVLLERTLRDVAARTESVRSIAIRRTDGAIAYQAGDHQRAWQPVTGERSRPEQVLVPLNYRGSRWGNVEIAFETAENGGLAAWLTQPLMVLLLFLSAGGTVVFGLYMRRALQHLDPASVIPERVQGAFDAMAEGVAVLDPRGRVLLVNRAFRSLHPEAAGTSIGQSLSGLVWLCGDDVSGHSLLPWVRAIVERSANAGHTLRIDDGGTARQLVVNCAPITDPGGAVRGCLATFSDVSELHRANTALRSAVAELSNARDEVEQQNIALHRLATRDPLTGCLNRRAFFDALSAMFDAARAGNGLLACLMLDIDHFKSVNDNHGHGVGDRLIAEVAAILARSVRPPDVVGRYGGEEFCIALAGLSAEAVLEIAEQIRARIESEAGASIDEVPGMRVTISIGVALLSDRDATLAVVLDRADQHLYRAKRTGRNRVVGEGGAPGPSVDASRASDGSSREPATAVTEVAS